MNEKMAKKLRRLLIKGNNGKPWLEYGLRVFDPVRKRMFDYVRKEGEDLWLRGLMIVNTGLRAVYQQRKRMRDLNGTIRTISKRQRAKTKDC